VKEYLYTSYTCWDCKVILIFCVNLLIALVLYKWNGFCSALLYVNGLCRLYGELSKASHKRSIIYGTPGVAAARSSPSRRRRPRRRSMIRLRTTTGKVYNDKVFFLSSDSFYRIQRIQLNSYSNGICSCRKGISFHICICIKVRYFVEQSFLLYNKNACFCEIWCSHKKAGWPWVVSIIELCRYGWASARHLDGKLTVHCCPFIYIWNETTRKLIIARQ